MLKFNSKFYFILSGVLLSIFIVLIGLHIDFITYGFLGGSIGSLLRGFHEQGKEKKSTKIH